MRSDVVLQMLEQMHPNTLCILIDQAEMPDFNVVPLKENASDAYSTVCPRRVISVTLTMAWTLVSDRLV